jgi:Flp pilus assembly protein TadD
LFSLLLFFALGVDPNEAAALLQRGLLALQHGQLTEARDALEQASRVDPNNPYVWASLAQTYFRLKDPAKASAAAETAEKSAAGNPLVAHALSMYCSDAGEFARAAKLERQYAESGKADAGAMSRAAELYLKAGDTNGALAAAKVAAQQDPRVAFNWTQIFLRRGDFTPAAEVVQSGLATHPNDTQLTLALGVARYGQRRFEDAVVAFLKVIQIDPTIEQPYLFLGRMLDQAGSHLDEITQDCEKWAEREPQNAKAQLVLAKALTTSNSNDDRAEALLRKAIALNPDDWEPHYELGVLLARKHMYPEAATELKRSTELDPKQPTPHYHLARVYDRLGKPDLAQAERETHQRLTNPSAQP